MWWQSSAVNVTSAMLSPSSLKYTQFITLAGLGLQEHRLKSSPCQTHDLRRPPEAPCARCRALLGLGCSAGLGISVLTGYCASRLMLGVPVRKQSRAQSSIRPHQSSVEGSTSHNGETRARTMVKTKSNRCKRAGSSSAENPRIISSFTSPKGCLPHMET